MGIEDNKDMIRRLFDEVWRNGEVDSVERFYAAGPILDDLQAFATGLCAAFPDWRATIDELVAEGDRVVVRWTGQSTHRGEWSGVAATNRQVTITGIDVEHFVDGKIVDEHSNVDMLGFMRQIGALATPAVG